MTNINNEDGARPSTDQTTPLFTPRYVEGVTPPITDKQRDYVREALCVLLSGMSPLSFVHAVTDMMEEILGAAEQTDELNNEARCSLHFVRTIHQDWEDEIDSAVECFIEADGVDKTKAYFVEVVDRIAKQMDCGEEDDEMEARWTAEGYDNPHNWLIDSEVFLMTFGVTAHWSVLLDYWNQGFWPKVAANSYLADIRDAYTYDIDLRVIGDWQAAVRAARMETYARQQELVSLEAFINGAYAAGEWEGDC